MSGLLLLGAAAYLVGSIPFGLVVARVKGIDLRSVGSGNIGAANAFRTLGPVGGVLVLLLDGAKGWGMATLGATPAARVVAGIGAIAGHNWSFFLGGKGGKGIATTFGVMLALSPSATLAAALVWGVVVGITRYASVGSLAAATTFPLALWWRGAPAAYLGLGLLAAVFAFVRHRGNIANLLAGRELKIRGKGAGPQPGE